MEEKFKYNENEVKVNDVFPVYILKYALTKGITKEIAIFVGGVTNMIMIGGKDSFWRRYYHRTSECNKQWCITQLEAEEIFNKLKENQIKGLHNKIKKLEGMKFKFEDKTN